MEKVMSWDEYFLNLLENIKLRSKDPNTKFGCVIVGPDNEIRSTGYNSLCRGVEAKPERLERPEKYLWIEHCDRNAIYNAARVGIPLNGCTMYLPALPCLDCSRGIIQCGIKVLKYSKEGQEKWDSKKYNKELAEKSLEMLKEAGVEVIPI